MTAAQFEDREGRDVRPDFAETWRTIGVPAEWITIPTTTRTLHLPTDKERA
ncbi:MAG: hypothetical protein M3536_00995 [Actinomycetota bacterium]|nr:hypothetical protein [Actinomycetota bacterium]